MTQQPNYPENDKSTNANIAENSTVNSSDPSNSNKAPSLVPMGFTIGLAMFALILSLAGYGFRLAFGESLDEVIQHAIIVVPVFVIGIPLLFWLGSVVMNKLTRTDIQTRNALSLGWLTSCVAMLWLMGTYS